jgi:hypothetical protein
VLEEGAPLAVAQPLAVAIEDGAAPAVAQPQLAVAIEDEALLALLADERALLGALPAEPSDAELWACLRGIDRAVRDVAGGGV